MTNATRAFEEFRQSIWYDNIQRSQLASGQFAQLIADGVRGCTSNPTIFDKAVSQTSDYDDALRDMAKRRISVEEMYYALVGQDIRDAADALQEIYRQSEARDGYISLEVQPNLASSTDATVAEAQRLVKLVGRDNLMIKVPATPEGLPAVTALIAAGISVNITLIFSIDSYREVTSAYIAGLEQAQKAGLDLSKIASVASFFVSRVDASVDKLLAERAASKPADADRILGFQGKAAIANAKLAYAAYKEIFSGSRFAPLRAKGAQSQRVLWASTGTKSKAYKDTLYLDSLIGPETVNTVPPQTLDAFQDHGTVANTLETGFDQAVQLFKELESLGINMDAVCDDLLNDGVKSFVQSMNSLMDVIAKKSQSL